MAELSHREAAQLAEDDWRADADNRDAALEDLAFIAGDQWDEAERAEREREGRPCLTINHLNGFVNQVAGDLRQARPSIDVFPVDNADDRSLAQIFEGLIRQIEYQSGAHAAYAHGAESAVRAGIGHWRFETVATSDSVFEQDIRIRRILDPLAVVWDAAAVELDRSDARHCWVSEWIHKSDFRRRFPEADRAGENVPFGESEGGFAWRRDDFIRIAEYWSLQPRERFLVLTHEGQTLDITDWGHAAVAALGPRVARARTVQGHRVVRRIMDGADWLTEEQPWAGRYIPVVPVLGAEIAYDGRVHRSGLIRYAKDAQKLYNFWRSAGAEAIGRAPKAPWLVTPAMIEGWEAYWNNANRSNMPYLPYNVDPDAPAGTPVRQAPPDLPQAMWQEGTLATDDMKRTTGIFDASLGATGNETSGRAILARQREGDVGSFVYSDNFAEAMRRSGQILVDLIPRIYDTARQVRLLGPDGAEQFALINYETLAFDGRPMLVNDLSHGRFDVRVTIGASYTTQRIEAREQMAQAMQGNPALWEIIGDLFFENSDYPGAQEIAQRLRRAVDPALLGEDAERPEDPMAEAVERLALTEKQADIAETEAKTRKHHAEATQTELETVVGTIRDAQPTPRPPSRGPGQ